MRSGERSRRAVRAALLVMLSFGSAVGVSGCAPLDPAPGSTPSPPPSAPAASAPVLPTNEEALAIVEELVPKFLAAEAAVFTGTEELEGLRSLATDEYVSAIGDSLGEMSAAGQKTTGSSRATDFRVQSVESKSGEAAIKAYACYDVTDFDVVDASGHSARVKDLPNRFTVVFEVVRISEVYKFNGSEPWSGANSCS